MSHYPLAGTDNSSAVCIVLRKNSFRNLCIKFLDSFFLIFGTTILVNDQFYYMSLSSLGNLFFYIFICIHVIFISLAGKTFLRHMLESEIVVDQVLDPVFAQGSTATGSLTPSVKPERLSRPDKMGMTTSTIYAKNGLCMQSMYEYTSSTSVCRYSEMSTRSVYGDRMSCQSPK